MDNMTARMSAFLRDWHYRNNETHVFRDEAAGRMLTEAERKEMENSLYAGASFFLPGFHGSRQETLRAIVDGALAPPVLARSAFCEKRLENAVHFGCEQYVLFGAGFDSFALRCPWPGLRCFELDRPELLTEKGRRLGTQAGCAVPVPCDLNEEGWEKTLLAAGFRKTVCSFGSPCARYIHTMRWKLSSGSTGSSFMRSWTGKMRSGSSSKCIISRIHLIICTLRRG